MCTLQGTNISPKNGILKMIFPFPRWDMLVPWRVSFNSLYKSDSFALSSQQATHQPAQPINKTQLNHREMVRSQPGHQIHPQLPRWSTVHPTSPSTEGPPPTPWVRLRLIGMNLCNDTDDRGNVYNHLGCIRSTKPCNGINYLVGVNWLVFNPYLVAYLLVIW